MAVKAKRRRKSESRSHEPNIEEEVFAATGLQRSETVEVGGSIASPALLTYDAVSPLSFLFLLNDFESRAGVGVPQCDRAEWTTSVLRNFQRVLPDEIEAAIDAAMEAAIVLAARTRNKSGKSDPSADELRAELFERARARMERQTEKEGGRPSHVAKSEGADYVRFVNRALPLWTRLHEFAKSHAGASIGDLQTAFGSPADPLRRFIDVGRYAPAWLLRRFTMRRGEQAKERAKKNRLSDERLWDAMDAKGTSKDVRGGPERFACVHAFALLRNWHRDDDPPFECPDDGTLYNRYHAFVKSRKLVPRRNETPPR